MRTSFTGLRGLLTAALILTCALGARASTTTDTQSFSVYKENAGTPQWVKTQTLAEALTALGTDEGAIYMPPGTHTISATISLYAEQRLIGHEDVTLRTTSASLDMVTIEGDETQIDYITFFRDIGAVGGSTTTTAWSSVTGSAVNTNGHRNCRMNYVNGSYHKNFVYDDTPSGTGSGGIEINYCNASYLGSHFIDFASGTATHDSCYLRYCGMDFVGGDAIYMRVLNSGVSFASVEDCQVKTTAGHGLNITGNNWFIREGLLTGPFNGEVIHMDDVKDAEIYGGYASSAGVTVTRSTNTKDPWTVDYNTRLNYDGITMTSSCEDVRVHNMDIAWNGNSGIYMTASKDIKVTGCSVHSNGQNGSTGYAGIELAGGFKDIIISANRTYNDPDITSASKFQDYGLLVNFTSNGDYLTVIGNDFHDSAATYKQSVDFKQTGNCGSNYTRTLNFGSRSDVGQVIANNSSTISPGGTDVYLDPTAPANYTLSTTPSVADGVNGQIIYIHLAAGKTNTVTLQDQGTLANSGLELGAATRTIGTRDVLTLMYDGTDWVEVAYSNN